MVMIEEIIIFRRGALGRFRIYGNGDAIRRASFKDEALFDVEIG